MLNKIAKLLRGDRQKLESLSVEELEAARRDAAARIVETQRAVEALERRDLAGLEEAEIEAHAHEVELARIRVKAAEDTERAVRAALAVARQREEEAADARDAATIGDELRAVLDEHDEHIAAARVARLRLSRVANRLTSEQLRRRLATDPTVGLRPQLRAALGDQLPLALRRLFDAGQPVPIPPPGPHEGDRRTVHGDDAHPGGRPEIFRDGKWVADEKSSGVRRRGRHPGLEPGPALRELLGGSHGPVE